MDRIKSPEQNRLLNWHFRRDMHNWDILTKITKEYLGNINKPKINYYNNNYDDDDDDDYDDDDDDDDDDDENNNNNNNNNNIIIIIIIMITIITTLFILELKICTVINLKNVEK